ncbi:MAG: D-alanyl-D-alanine carboxypeptidase family protein [Aquihabitans sp.]
MRRRSLAITAAAALMLLGSVAPQLAESAPTGDPRAEREQVRAEAAMVAANIDTSKASLSEVDAALQTLQADLNTQQAALARAEKELAQAEKDIVDAEASIEELTTEISALRDEMRRRAVQAFVNPTEDDVLTTLDTQDYSSAANQRFYVELRAQDDADVENRLEGASVDLEAQRVKATEARETADAKRTEQSERTASVADAKARQQKVSNSLETSINQQVARSLELADTDRELSAEIARQQAELLARLVAQREAEAKAAKTRATEAHNAELNRVRQAEAAAAANVSAGGQETAPSAPSAPSTGGGTAVVEPGPNDSGVQLAYVQGIPVNAMVANQVTAMINAAAADGVSLRIGNSYRSVARQIELRRSNCGSSSYAIYDMPSGSCRPPTAKPGRSQHQLGLAIDFANCSSRGTACYQWLAGNASRFGYYNLPSEAWHWSTTGS